MIEPVILGETLGTRIDAELNCRRLEFDAL
jgi:hypothetical protein